MGVRIQGINESVSQFGKSLIEMDQKWIKSENTTILKNQNNNSNQPKTKRNHM
jgi:hypothetical protein